MQKYFHIALHDPAYVWVLFGDKNVCNSPPVLTPCSNKCCMGRGNGNAKIVVYGTSYCTCLEAWQMCDNHRCKQLAMLASCIYEVITLILQYSLGPRPKPTPARIAYSITRGDTGSDPRAMNAIQCRPITDELNLCQWIQINSACAVRLKLHRNELFTGCMRDWVRALHPVQHRLYLVYSSYGWHLKSPFSTIIG